MNPVKTCFSAEDLARYWNCEMPADRSERVEQHLAECSTCLELVRALEAKDAFCRRVKSTCARAGAGSVQQGNLMITIPCSGCQKKLSVKEDLAGKKVKCPGCGQVTIVPAKVAVAVGKDDGTLPSQEHSVPAESHVAIGERPTHPPLDKPDGTDVPEAGPDTSLTDFLAPPQSADELGRLGAFRILKILGHGGMGVVFLGEDAKLGRRVAIKAMLPNLAQSKSSQQRFLREARAAAALEHDNIVPIFHVGEDRGTSYIVMPFLKGQPLDERLKGGEQLPLVDVLRIGREVARALDAAHKSGLIHRDIKPANIWLEAPEERVKILDFGLARAASGDAGLTQAGAIIGTPAYMAPEQGRGDAVDHRCDLFSLGVVLYRMCTGTIPFVGKDAVSTLMAVAVHEPPAPVMVNFELPQELSDLVMKLLEKDAAKRITSAGDVVAALQTMEDELKRQKALEEKTIGQVYDPPSKATTAKNPISGDTVTIVGPSLPRRSKKPLLGIALLLLCGLVVAGGIYGIIRIPTPEGDYVIKTDDPDFSFSVSKGTVILNDKKAKREYKLNVVKQKGGEFELEVTDPGNDLAFNTKTFSIKRGETVALKAWFERKQVAEVVDDVPLANVDAGKPGPVGKSPLDRLDPAAIPPEERFPWQPKELVAVLGSHRQRHGGDLYGVAISDDGKRVAAGSGIWDFDTGKEVGWVPMSRYPAFSPDGRRMFDGWSRFNDIGRWLEERKKQPEAEPKDAIVPLTFSSNEGDYVTHPQFSADGTTLVACRYSPTRVALWQVGKDAQRIGEWPGFFSPALSLDGKILAVVAAKDRTVHLFDIQGDKVQPRGALPTEEAKTPDQGGGRAYLGFAHDGRLGVLSADRKSIAFWDVAGPKLRKLGAVAIDAADGFRIAAKAPRMVTFFSGGTIEVWRLTDKGAEPEAKRPDLGLWINMNINDVAISADGNRLASGHLNGAVLFWEVKDGKLAQRNPITPQPAQSWSYANFHFSPTGEYLTTFGEAGTTIWHLGDKSPKGFLPAQLRGEVFASAFFGPDAFAIGAGRTIRTWRVGPTSVKQIGEYSLPSYAMAPLASPATGLVVARFTQERKDAPDVVSGRVFDMKDPFSGPEEFFQLGARGMNIDHTAALSADGRVFASWVAPPDGKTDTIRVFDIQNGNTTKRYDIVTNLGGNGTQRIRLSRDGQWLAASGAGNPGALWRLSAGEAKFYRTAGVGGFSPDGKRMAVLTESYGRTLEIRDVESWHLLWSTRIPGGMNDAVFAPDGRHLLVANANHTAYILRLELPVAPERPAADRVPLFNGKDGSKLPQEKLSTAATPVMKDPGRHQTFLDVVKKGNIDVVFFGDSITDLWRTEGKIVWQETFVPMKAANFGIAGDRTEHVLWRIQNGELEGIQPKAVVLLIGSANLAVNSTEEIAQGLKVIVEATRKKQPNARILLLGIFPRGQEPTDPIRDKIKEINKIAAKLDDGKMVRYLDIGDKFLEKDGTLSKEVMPDFIHPSAKGYQIWADAIKEPLDAARNATDWVPLFNGKDLAGWQGLVTVKQRASMTKQEYEGALKKANDAILPHWKVENGILYYDGQGDNLQTDKEYGDFELLVDWKIAKGGDSGIYLRGNPQVQIWEHADGSGGLYNNQKNPSRPLKKADRPVGEWNTFRILMRGDRVTVYLNGELVVDNTPLENYWEPGRPLPARGPIELQHQGGPLWFRNIRIRELGSGQAP